MPIAQPRAMYSGSAFSFTIFAYSFMQLRLKKLRFISFLSGNSGACFFIHWQRYIQNRKKSSFLITFKQLYSQQPAFAIRNFFVCPYKYRDLIFFCHCIFDRGVLYFRYRHPVLIDNQIVYEEGLRLFKKYESASVFIFFEGV